MVTSQLDAISEDVNETNSSVPLHSEERDITESDTEILSNNNGQIIPEILEIDEIDEMPVKIKQPETHKKIPPA